jgi:hypothetical protein
MSFAEVLEARAWKAASGKNTGCRQGVHDQGRCRQVWSRRCGGPHIARTSVLGAQEIRDPEGEFVGRRAPHQAMLVK